MEIILPLIIQLGLAMLTQGPRAIENLIAVGEQTGALPPEEANKVRQQMLNALASRAWQTDEQLAGVPDNDPVLGTAPPPGAAAEGPLASAERADDAVPPPARLTRAPGNG